METSMITPKIFNKEDFKQALDKVKSICLSNPIEGLEEAKALSKCMEGHMDILSEALLWRVTGIGYHVAKDYGTALKYFKKSLEVFESLNLIENIAGTQNWMALSCNAVENTDESLILLFKSLRLIEEYDLGILEFRTYTCLGATYQSIYNSEKAIECFEKALLTCPESERAIALSNLASIYSNQTKHQQALVYLKEAYALKNKAIIPMNHAYITTNLVICLGEMHDYDAILPIIGELEVMVESLKDTFFVHLYFTCLMGLYLRCREAIPSIIVEKLMSKIDIEATVVYLKQIIERTDTDNLRAKLNACDLLVAYYELDEQWKEVSYYQKKLLELNAKKFEKEKMEATERLLIKHEVAQKEQKIKIQELELEKKEIELQKKQALEIINQQLEEKVASRTAKLTLQNQQLQEFAFIVSHDLREPLCNIHGIADLLTQTYQTDLSGELQIFLEQIGRGAERMNILLKDLLEYTVIEQSMERFTMEKVDSSEVLRLVIENLQSQIIESEAVISIDSLPLLHTYSYGLRLLFEHLLSNAIKFKSTKHPCQVQISCSESVAFYTFAFKDNGIGIEEAYLEEIFRPFKRLDRKDYKGTGIGLAICKKILQVWGGAISVVSELEVGSTFYFTIPKLNIKVPNQQIH